MNGGQTTHYFNSEHGACHGDPISAYLFILVLGILFILGKSNKNIHGIKIFKHSYLYIAYADNINIFTSCVIKWTYTKKATGTRSLN